LNSLSPPRFSVCIRAHSRPAALQRAIRSALAQDVDDLEVVVSDDSGQLGDAVADVGDERVRYHPNRGQRGSIGNLRHVCSLARGEMVVVVDDDDQLLPRFLSVTGEPMERDESVGVVFTNFMREAGGGRRQYTLPVPGGAVEDPLRMILAGSQPGRSATLLRREALEQGEADFPLLDGHIGDLTTWLRTAAGGWGFWAVPQPHVVVAVHRGQLSAREDPVRMARTFERFRFDDPTAETLRRSRAADARRRYAVSLAVRGRIGAARREISTARATAPRPRLREALASLAANAPALHRLSVRYPRFGALLRDARSRVAAGGGA
jgi:glycosyltransferase involved in cell wall biosynthesis